MSQQRERGSGGLFRIPGSRFWYGQFHREGRAVRFSTKTDIKAEAQRELRKRMGDSERGIVPVSEIRKIRYADLRAALIQNYIERGNDSLQTLSDSTQTIWGLKPLDRFFKFSDGKGASLSQIDTDAARKFARERLEEGLSNDMVNGSLRLLRRMLNIAHEDGKLTTVPKIRMLKNGQHGKAFSGAISSMR
jgi:hypothetical protein